MFSAEKRIREIQALRYHPDRWKEERPKMKQVVKTKPITPVVDIKDIDVDRIYAFVSNCSRAIYKLACIDSKYAWLRLNSTMMTYSGTYKSIREAMEYVVDNPGIDAVYEFNDIREFLRWANNV